MRKTFLLAIAAAGASAVFAQGTRDTIELPPAIERLAQAADETVDVMLDPGMIRFAEKFLSDRKPDEAHAKRLLRGVRGVRIRVFEFGREGAYSAADLEPLRSKLRSPGWSRVVEVRSRRDGENVDIFMRLENGEVAGLFIVSAEPRELAIVEIDGTLQPADLAEVGGYAGIPRWIAGRRGGAR